MAHLLSFIDTTPQFEVPQPPEPSSWSPARSINASPKSALLVENDESLLKLLKTLLKNDGYAVRTAANTEEGLRLYHDFAPFNVVLINYYVPPENGAGIDYLAPRQTHGIELALAIRKKNPSQGMIIAALDYPNAGDVPRPQELMNIPLLIRSSTRPLRSLLQKIEIDRMIEMLTKTERLRLQRFAEFRVRGLGRAARGRTWEDLLAEAVLRTLIGAEGTQKGRRWNKNVDFVMHLTGAMRSISSSWKRKFTEMEAYLISELPTHDAEGREQSLDNVASGQTAADQSLIEKSEEDRILTMFKDDLEATEVLRGLLDGLKKAEILSKFGLGETKYVAALKRIRVRLLGRKDAGGRGEKHGR
jgi:CheY-like chemotaxis protein